MVLCEGSGMAICQSWVGISSLQFFDALCVRSFTRLAATVSSLQLGYVGVWYGVVCDFSPEKLANIAWAFVTAGQGDEARFAAMAKAATL